MKIITTTILLCLALGGCEAPAGKEVRLCRNIEGERYGTGAFWGSYEWHAWYTTEYDRPSETVIVRDATDCSTLHGQRICAPVFSYPASLSKCAL